MDQNFYRGKKVFLSGHSGFKGAWLSCWLKMMGAKVCGFSLKPENESLFNILELSQELDESHFGDIRNVQLLEKTINNFQPEIIIHMAAQALVKSSYFDPRTTYETNVIGTLNIFEAARKAGSVKAIVNITTDKCYENKEINYAYQEEDPMGGYDPYSSSKACAEILTSSYRRSFMQKEGIALASVRAGNVIGGGDFSIDRIIPDIFRSIRDGKKVELRSPNAIRPWQHVMEPLLGYLTLAQNLFEKGNDFAKAYNFGPEADAQENVETLTKIFIQKIGVGAYEINANPDLHEAGILMLNNNRAKNELKWQPKLSFAETISWTADWYKKYLEKNTDMKEFTIEQIRKLFVRKKLSICIPTLNRLGYLKSCLESVMPQVDDEVEVCVSNNFSDDKTAEFLETLSQLHKNFRYQNNLQRLDIDSSMQAAISMGEGEYLMLLGDDDVLLEGAILAIKKQLNENFDLIIANGFNTDPALKPLRQHLSPQLQDAVFTNLETAFTNLWDKMPFGSFLAKKECFEEKTYNKYIETSHAYSGVIWEYLQNSSSIKIKCMKEGVVFLRGAEKTWAQNTATIFLVGIPKWFRLLSYCSKIRKAVILAQENFLNQHAKPKHFRAFRKNGQLKNIKFLMSELPLSRKIKIWLVFKNLI